MIIFKKAAQLTHYVLEQKMHGKKIGFVPTMGALHNGHLSLIQHSKEQTDITVCSIFVNPTQFNNKEDFQRYPISVENDIEKLCMAACDVLFLPDIAEIYPPNYPKKQYDLGYIETILEGHYRPGHFQGVCQVVDRLIQIVSPDTLFLGQKDFQQCMVVKRLLELTDQENKVQLTIVPTVREENGLAMSSRNLRLNDEEKQTATVIYHTLSNLKHHLSDTPLSELENEASKQLTAQNFKVDYVSIANANTLQPAQNTSEPLVALVAATIDSVRLIDNMLLN